MITNTQHLNMLISPARSIVGKVELFNGSTLLQTFSHTDALSSFTLSRAGDKKFFGFGICQELELKLVDSERTININENNILKISFGLDGNFIYPTPKFYVSADIKRDENTNELTIKSYDALYAAAAYNFANLNLEAPYSIKDVANAIASILGLNSVSVIGLPSNSDPFAITYVNGANFEGIETLRNVLNAIAEATQTIYFVNNEDNLVFKRLDIAADPDLTIRRADYFTLESKTNRKLSNICSATELGDNVITTSGIEGEVQYIRDNPFLELRDDVGTLLDVAITELTGLQLNQFNCKWRGNYLVEPGDKIGITTKDGNTVISYLLNDKYTYNGGLAAETNWEYAENEAETPENPTSLGDAIKKTFAKVDKANKQINLVVNKVDNYDSRLTAIELNTDSITSSVEQIQKNTDNRLDSIDGEIDTLTNKVEATISSEAVEIKIKEAMSSGVNSVSTETGFTFNDIGLTVSKSGSEMKTTITEDGMRVFKNDDEMLVADNKGVKAVNLHATTYLHIGTYSRFQDYENRTGCFWIV